MAGTVRPSLPADATRLNLSTQPHGATGTISGTPKGSKARHPSTPSDRKTAETGFR